MSDPLSALMAVGGTEADATGASLPNIPAVPNTSDAGLRNILQAMKLWMDKAADSGGASGFATKHDMLRSGVMVRDPSGSIVPSIPASSAIPPVPTHLTATGAVANIILEWDDPRRAYGNHAYTEVWAAGSDNFSVAALIGTAFGSLFAHTMGSSAQRWYWVRFVSTSDVRGPFSSIDGEPASTAIDIPSILEALNGQIDESLLIQSLRDRIDLIDESGTGLVTQVSMQHAALGNLSAQYTVKIDNNGYVTGYGLASTTVNSTPTSEFAILADKFTIAPSALPGYNAGAAYVVGNRIAVGSVTYESIAPTTGNAPPNATYWKVVTDSPFFYLTTPTTINGVEVPAGAYMNDAYIPNLHASKIVAGNIAADRITAAVISAINGSFETINAERINGTNLNVVNGAFSGALLGATGSFSGSLNAASGSFGGELLAGVLDATQFSGETHIFSTAGPFSVPVPVGKTTMKITVMGGGGGGGGGGISNGFNVSARAGGGGGAATVQVGTYSGLTAGATITGVVGSGAVGGVGMIDLGRDSTSGSNGTSSSVAGYLVSAGGTGGDRGIYGGSGGAGGISNGQTGGSDNNGADGGAGGSSSVASGGLGGYGVPGHQAGDGLNGISGSGGGGGGSSGYIEWRSGGNGGRGGDGYVIIEFYNPNSVVLTTSFNGLRDKYNALAVAMGRSDLQYLG